VPDFDAAEAMRELQDSRTIWAHEGTKFVLRISVNEEASVDRALSGDPSFITYELTGPDDQPYVWLFSMKHELLPDPSHADLDRSWPVLAELALGGYEAWSEAQPGLA
jgi:hypothetical protein